MDDRESNEQVLAVVLRPNGRIGGGITDVFHVDASAVESLVSQCRHEQVHGASWLRDITPVITGAREAGLLNVILDLQNAVWINSTGLGELVTLQHEVREGGGAFVLAGVSARIASTLKVTYLEDSFVTVGSTAEAVGRLALEE
jgi:anti-anti-sigma factor